MSFFQGHNKGRSSRHSSYADANRPTPSQSPRGSSTPNGDHLHAHQDGMSAAHNGSDRRKNSSSNFRNGTMSKRPPFLSMPSQREESPTSRQNRENNLAAVLIGISFLFIFCQSAKIIPDLYEVKINKLPFVCI